MKLFNHRFQLNDSDIRKLSGVIIAAFVIAVIGLNRSRSAAEQTPQQKTTAPAKAPSSGYLGSSECRSCHEKFYQLWAPSHHGLAMQPYTEDFAQKELKPQKDPIAIKPYSYQAVIDQGAGYVIETGPKGQQKYPILHVLGGKNIYYFLTELDRGYLQVLPVAFDIRRQHWYDTAASGVRHFPDRDEDEPFNWKDRPYTFNSSCYGCHVSQLVKNYDPATDTYNTRWTEPGINCETCHGPAEAHVRVCVEAGEGRVPGDLRLTTVTRSRGFTAHQVDTACLTCHAKAAPITAEFKPGEDFFQHYDLTTLEHPDYYPDGRDLGENYTCTSWTMSPCANAGKLDCLTCHTSSGRYRFKGENANDACVNCHTDKRGDFVKHSRHTPESGVTECVQCHMPKSEFGRMVRSDHSMRPPMPAATIRFKSPNACNMCHQDKSPEWADKEVREWHDEDYQKPTLDIAALVDEARKDNWKNLPAMLDYIRRPDRDVIFANSLIRLLRNSSDSRIAPVLIKVLEKDASPLIRASAADVLGMMLTPDAVPALVDAVDDPCRLVRIRAAVSLASVPAEYIRPEHAAAVEKAQQEFVAASISRPDNAASYYNLGNFHMNKNRFDQAIDSYEFAMRLDSTFVMPYVNASLVYNRLGQNDKALAALKQAIAIDPKSAVAHLNLALLYGEMKQYDKAAAAFRKTFELDAASAVAAYNLCVLLAEKDADESIQWGLKALELQPDNARYAYTLAFYLNRAGRTDETIALLEPFVKSQTTQVNIYMLLADVYLKTGDRAAAARTYEAGANNPNLPQQTRALFNALIQQLTR